jgi:DNA-nicking Smr family endonuclease
MAGRRLSPEEREAWDRVARSVRPGRPAPAPVETLAPPVGKPGLSAPKTSLTTAKPTTVVPEPVRRPVAKLDNSWEKRIRGGQIVPDLSVDLHGHTLAAAHLRLNRVLAFALNQEARVLLVVTGRPRNPAENGGSSGRGAIRAEIGHWLSAGAHADLIASVRTAHPRHGGAGALYVILRRKKT